jgi:hypothetical protein
LYFGILIALPWHGVTLRAIQDSADEVELWHAALMLGAKGVTCHRKPASIQSHTNGNLQLTLFPRPVIIFTSSQMGRRNLGEQSAILTV